MKPQPYFSKYLHAIADNHRGLDPLWVERLRDYIPDNRTMRLCNSLKEFSRFVAVARNRTTRAYLRTTLEKVWDFYVDEKEQASDAAYDNKWLDDTPTKYEVLDALKNLQAVTDNRTAMHVLKKVGKVDGLSKLEETRFAAVVAAANKRTVAAQKASQKFG